MDISVLHTFLKYLVATPIDDISKRRQKVLSASVIELLKKVDKIPSNSEIVTLLMLLGKLHKDSDLPANLLIADIRFDQFSNFKDTVFNYANEKVTAEELSGYINLSRKLMDDMDVDKTIDDTLMELSNLKTNEKLTSDMKEKVLGILMNKYLSINKKSEESSELRLSPKTLSEAFEKVKALSANRVIVKSNYKILDEYILRNGGFESGRIYVFGGKPGGGKSSILLNFLANASKPSYRKKDDKKDVIVYITLENDIVETVDRYASLILSTSITIKDVPSTQQPAIYDAIYKHDEMSGCDRIIKWMVPYSTSSIGIISYLESLTTEYNIRMVFIDYLDLVKSSQDLTEKRFELGQVTTDLRVMAKRFSIPVITATQLNTSGYKGLPTMANVDESRQKVQNADFVGLLFDIQMQYLPSRMQGSISPDKYALIGVNVDKNRNGATNKFVCLHQKDCYKMDPLDKRDSDIIMANWLSGSINESRYDF
jgi:replicative DNA helicase